MHGQSRIKFQKVVLNGEQNVKIPSPVGTLPFQFDIFRHVYKTRLKNEQCTGTQICIEKKHFFFYCGYMFRLITKPHSTTDEPLLAVGPLVGNTVARIL